MQLTHFAHCQYQSMSKKRKTLHGDDQNTSAPCPRCKSGLFTPGKSIQIHLARHCTMRLLWNNPTIRNSKSTMQSQDQMLAGSVHLINKQNSLMSFQLKRLSHCKILCHQCHIYCTWLHCKLMELIPI